MESNKNQNSQKENSDEDSPFEVPPMKLSTYEEDPKNFETRKSEDN